MLLAAAVVGVVTAHTIDIPAKSKECFFEDLHSEDKVSWFLSYRYLVGVCQLSYADTFGSRFR